MAPIEEGALTHWWALHARDQGDGCQPVSPPPTFIDRLIKWLLGTSLRALVSCLQPWPAVGAGRRPAAPSKMPGPGSEQEALSSCHPIRGSSKRRDRKPLGGLPRFPTAAACPSIRRRRGLLKAPRPEWWGRGGGGGRRGRSWKPEVVKRCSPVPEQPGRGCLLLLHGSLLSCALLARGLALGLGLAVPRGLLEHKPTVPGPQEEVDKAEKLQGHRVVCEKKKGLRGNREGSTWSGDTRGEGRGLQNLKGRTLGTETEFKAIAH